MSRAQHAQRLRPACYMPFSPLTFAILQPTKSHAAAGTRLIRFFPGGTL